MTTISQSIRMADHAPLFATALQQVCSCVQQRIIASTARQFTVDNSPVNPKKKKKEQISGVCSSWLRGKDPRMTLAAFQSFWCHNGILASVTSPSGDVDGRLELQSHLSATCPVLLF